MPEEVLTHEQQLTLLLSRLVMSESEKLQIATLAIPSVNWFAVLEFGIRHKVVGLMYRNLKQLQATAPISYPVLRAMSFYYLGTRERNDAYLAELETVGAHLRHQGIPAIPVKGSRLIPELYQDRGLRTVNDLDFLIRATDIRGVEEAMRSLGYVQGSYDPGTRTAHPMPREKKIAWQKKMHNLPVFVKAHDSPYVECLEVDFSFSLDLSRNTVPVEAMIGRAQATQMADPDFFVHLCCHLYREASSAVWIYLGGDMSLIKFCDVREFIRARMTAEKLDEAILFAREHGLEKAVYYTIHCLNHVYHDGYESEFLSRMGIHDPEFVNYFGEHDLGRECRWHKTFWRRLFSDSNRDELDRTQSFLRSYARYADL